MSEEYIKFLDYHVYAYDKNNQLKTKKINIPLTVNIWDFFNMKEKEGYSLAVIYKKLLDKNFKNCDFIDIVIYILNFYDPTFDYRFEIYNNDKTQFFKLYYNEKWNNYMLTLNYDKFFMNMPFQFNNWSIFVFNMFYLFSQSDSTDFLINEYNTYNNSKEDIKEDYLKCYYNRLTEFYNGYLQKHSQNQ